MSLSLDQIAFLALCIEHAKIDMELVAQDYERLNHRKLSKHAAEERLRRMKEKLGVKKMRRGGELKNKGDRVKSEPDGSESAKKIKIEYEDGS